MSKMIQVRDVPDQIHKILKARAAGEGMSLSDFLKEDLDRIWQLGHNFTAYDAVYIALAEAMKATLYTTDAKLCRGHRARVVLAG